MHETSHWLPPYTDRLRRYHRYAREIPEPAPFLSKHGAQIGDRQGFPVFKITTVHQVLMSPVSILWSEREDSTGINATRCAKIMDAFCFCICGQQKPKAPQFEPCGWQRHYTGWYTRSGISLVYLWMTSEYLSQLIKRSLSLVISNTGNMLLKPQSHPYSHSYIQAKWEMFEAHILSNDWSEKYRRCIIEIGGAYTDQFMKLNDFWVCIFHVFFPKL